jgi:hypothetical protein
MMVLTTPLASLLQWHSRTTPLHLLALWLELALCLQTTISGLAWLLQRTSLPPRRLL